MLFVYECTGNIIADFKKFYDTQLSEQDKKKIFIPTYDCMKRYQGSWHVEQKPLFMYKKSAVLKSGNYQSVLLYEDYDLFARMVLEYHIKSYNIPEPLYYIRTSEDFFKRRGGIKYAKTVLKFKWGQYRKGYMSLMDFCISGLGQAFVCVLPNSLRKSFYMKFLRK